MGKEAYRGIFKLLEEMHELGVELMKLAPFPDGQHPSSRYEGRSIDDAIREELADVDAAIRYFVERNPKLTPDPERVAEKLKKFRKWGLAGLNKSGTKEGVYRTARAEAKKAERKQAYRGAAKTVIGKGESKAKAKPEPKRAKEPVKQAVKVVPPKEPAKSAIKPPVPKKTGVKSAKDKSSG